MHIARDLSMVIGEELPLYNLLSLTDEAPILSNVFSVTWLVSEDMGTKMWYFFHDTELYEH